MRCRDGGTCSHHVNQAHDTVSDATNLYHAALSQRILKDNQSLYLEIIFCQQLNLYRNAGDVRQYFLAELLAVSRFEPAVDRN